MEEILNISLQDNSERPSFDLTDSVRAVTISKGMDRFIEEFIRPHFVSDGATINDLRDYQNLINRLSGRVVRSLFDEVVEVTGTRSSKNRDKRSEVKVYMVDKKARELFAKVGQFLADLARLNNIIVLPESEEELSCLVAMVTKAIKTGRPISLFTPVCPDWSRDSQGRYDFRSLGGGESFIANKFFVNVPEFLEILRRNGVPYKGVILFADWGLETEIDAKGTYGQKFSLEDVQMCFASTFAATDQTLKLLQDDVRFGPLFTNYEAVSMKEFLGGRIDEQKVMNEMRQFFTTDKRGLRLLEVLNRDSLAINEKRLGVSDESKNRELTLRNLIEYSTVGQAIDDYSVLIVCESRTTSRSYNLPRARDKKMPLFYVKGRGDLDSGVNIL